MEKKRLNEMLIMENEKLITESKNFERLNELKDLLLQEKQQLIDMHRKRAIDLEMKYLRVKNMLTGRSILEATLQTIYKELRILTDSGTRLPQPVMQQFNKGIGSHFVASNVAKFIDNVYVLSSNSSLRK
jgi:hypothetical protein